MKRWRLALLIFELALFAIILVLPQVDLPDFTFHGGTSPVATQARLASAVARVAVAIPMQPWLAGPALEAFPLTSERPDFYSFDSRLSLLCTLIC